MDINQNNIHDNTSGSGANIPDNVVIWRAVGYVDINAENNWWGTTDLTEIEETVWHFIDDASLAIVDYDPILTQSASTP